MTKVDRALGNPAAGSSSGRDAVVPTASPTSNGRRTIRPRMARRSIEVERIEEAPVRRMVLEVVEAPLESPPRTARADGGRDRAGDRRRPGDRAGVRGRPEGPGLPRDPGQARRGAGGDAESDGTCVWADLTSPAAVATLLDRVRERGRLAALVHALPLREMPPAGLDPVAWSARIGPELRGLFLLVRAGADALCRAAKEGGACLIAATGLGGAFASAGTAPDDFFPGHGGIAGLIKTVAKEWPEVRAGSSISTPAATSRCWRRTWCTSFWPTTAGSRWATSIAAAWRSARSRPRSPGADPAWAVALAPEEPIIVTGGARGITATVAADLARRWRPTLLLVGTSPLPPDYEDSSTARDRRGAPSSRQSCTRTSPGRVVRSVRPTSSGPTSRCGASARSAPTWSGSAQAGAVVAYSQADVRDAVAMRRLLDDWQGRFGPVAGLIHGAGVIHDRWLRDKSPEAFDRVLATKIEGALTLAGLLDPDALRFAAFFSSVAGRFGNRGQSDYAAANETLNKLALWLDKRWAGRVVSLIWGPWSGVGMVSDLEGHLGRRGLGMIAPALGCPAAGGRAQARSQGGRRGDRGRRDRLVDGRTALGSERGANPSPAPASNGDGVALTFPAGGVVR